MIPQEPADGVEHISIRVHFGDGTRIIRNFQPDTMQVYIFIMSVLYGSFELLIGPVGICGLK